MQFLMTAITATAGMVFSFGIALLAEEVIFGKVLPLFFSPSISAGKATHER